MRSLPPALFYNAPDVLPQPMRLLDPPPESFFPTITPATTRRRKTVRAMKNKTFAIPADATEISVNPKMPEITAMMAKIMEYLIMPLHRIDAVHRAYESRW